MSARTLPRWPQRRRVTGMLNIAICRNQCIITYTDNRGAEIEGILLMKHFKTLVLLILTVLLVAGVLCGCAAQTESSRVYHRCRTSPSAATPIRPLSIWTTTVTPPASTWRSQLRRSGGWAIRRCSQPSTGSRKGRLPEKRDGRLPVGQLFHERKGGGLPMGRTLHGQPADHRRQCKKRYLRHG